MKLLRARVQGYRCIDDETLELGPLTAFVGTGGVGKSAFLRALDWCINELPSDDEDLHRDAAGDAADEMVVTLTFGGLTDGDREILGRYGLGDITTIVRSWKPGEDPKLSGSAYFYPPFDVVRATEGRERTARYKELFDEKAEEIGLPAPRATTMADVERDMDRFERENAALCELRSPEASHMFGFAGGPRLRDCIDYVLVEGSVDASDQFGAGRDSALSRLLANLGGVDEQTQERIDQLQTEAQERIEELYGAARKGALDAVAAGVTSRVHDYVPDAVVELTEELQPPSAPDARPVFRVSHGGGHPTDVARQGHGLQRALILAALQVLAEPAAVEADQEGERPPGKALLLAIEEPELYQHPLQARAVASALQSLARPEAEPQAQPPQILYSTHSSYFVRPTLFEDLRLFRRVGAGAGVSRVTTADASVVAAALAEVGLVGEIEAKVRKTLSASLSEAIFAKAVLLCEGKTDAALLEAVAGRDRPFDQDGIAVAICWGKSIIPIALAILRQLDIPAYVLFDADAHKRAQIEGNENLASADKEGQIGALGRLNQQLLRVCGDDPQEWPEREVRANSANFAGNLESDVAEIWPELVAERDRIATELSMPAKSEEVYRRASEDAGELPPFFAELLAKIRGLI